jgi:hypothetical protein
VIATVVATLAAATSVTGPRAAPDGAARAHVATTCARQTRMVGTPGGLVVGFLARGAPVIVLRRTANHRWTEVRAVHSLVGWIHTRDLC